MGCNNIVTKFIYEKIMFLLSNAVKEMSINMQFKHFKTALLFFSYEIKLLPLKITLFDRT